MDELNQAIEAAKAELAMLQAEIDTLKARKSIIECIRETFAQARTRPDYDLDDGAEREINYPDWDDRELN